SSSNKSEWIQNLIADYKKDLNERKINLDDDYIKFIRYGEHLIEKTGEGVLAYISNNSFIDGITHRQMRKHLLETFDKIYILDLHGSAKKKEVCPDGSKDENVFDIMQGVSINIFVKTGKKKKNELGKVFHYDLYGVRGYKYKYLRSDRVNVIKWNLIQNEPRNNFFVKINFAGSNEYQSGFSICDLMKINNSGVSTDRDSLFTDFDKTILLARIEKLLAGDYDGEFVKKYNVEDSSGYHLLKKISKQKFNKNFIQEYQYRPFDFRRIYFDSNIISRPAKEVTKNLVNKNNISLIVPRQVNDEFHHAFLSKNICDSNITSSARLFGAGKLFPLYLYPETESKTASRTPNLNSEIVQKIADGLGLKFTNEKESNAGTFAPIDILDYIYAVLHSPTYREKYKEFLKIDFPRVPYPKDKETFWKLVRLGGELRQLHLLESPAVEKYITKYPADGDNVVNKIKYQDGKVYINDTQHFANVPEVAWSFFIGGYQPSQKWLKDRKGRKLEFDDILHYQKIIVALTETDRIMKEVDKVEVE
ncbi:MAG: DNA methyltransferase, partial [Candidatus Delongbacteria bacterium]|nr:DNA methyltransferase [Candidatus Delongbacteria bacterium]